MTQTKRTTKRFDTRLLYAFEWGKHLHGIRVNLGRFGHFVWLSNK